MDNIQLAVVSNNAGGWLWVFEMKNGNKTAEKGNVIAYPLQDNVGKVKIHYYNRDPHPYGLVGLIFYDQAGNILV